MALRYIVQGLFVISVALAVLVAIALITLRLLAGQLLAVQSNSMEPIFQRNDAVITLPISSKDMQEGQIISYRNPTGNGITVSHRVTAIDRQLQTVTTLGDAQHSPDTIIPISAISGRVLAVVPGLGRVLTVARHPAALVLLIYIPAIFLVYREVSRMHSHFKTSRCQSATG